LGSRLLLGVTIGLLLAIPGLFYPFLGGVAKRAVSLFQVIPGLAWIPIAMLLFGIGERATIFIITTMSFIPLFFTAISSIEDLPSYYHEVIKMFGGDRIFYIKRVLIPATLPSLITGLRVALGSSWRVLIAAEMISGSERGLGYSILQSRWSLDFTSSLAVIVVIATLGVLFEYIVFGLLERVIIGKYGEEKS
jgi:NitT/TauT family transport system permease protein/taurine transport system permease protein